MARRPVRREPAGLVGVVLVVAGAMFVAGCGDGSDPTATDDSTVIASVPDAPSSLPEPATDPAASSSVTPTTVEMTPAVETVPGDSTVEGAGSWRMMAASPLSPRSSPVAVWTGAEMLVWSGVPSTSDDCGMDVGGGPMCGEPAVFDGAAYDPVTDSWRAIADGPVPAGGAPTQVIPRAAWTGSEMVVWGGWGTPIAAAYDPVTDQWRDLPPGPLTAREEPAVISWDGRVAVLGGRSPFGLGESQPYVDGAVLDPGTGEWQALPVLPAGGPTESLGVIAAIDADGRLVVVRLANGDTFALDPGATEWRSLGSAKLAGFAQPVGIAAGQWLFATAAVVGGADPAAAVLDLGTEQWTATDSPTGITNGYLSAGVGDVVLVVAARWADDTSPALALSWNPATGKWAELAPPPLEQRVAVAVASTGDELLVWGGLATSGFGGEGVDDGAALHP